MFGAMLNRLARQVGIVVLALGVFLSGTAPGWAMSSMLPGKATTSASMSAAMPGMAMQTDCMTMMAKTTPAKNAPCKNPGGCCAAVCTSCALPIAAIGETTPLLMLRDGDEGMLAYDVNRSGISTPPALPPPILRA